MRAEMMLNDMGAKENGAKKVSKWNSMKGILQSCALTPLNT